MKTITMLTLAGTLAFAVPASADTPAPSTPDKAPSAQSLCSEERTKMGRTVFADTYGTNKNKSNAFGKCVSKRNASSTAAEKAAKTNAAKACKKEEADNPTAFAAKYGTGKNGANAYGKCVSGKAKAEHAAKVNQETKDNVNAAKSCKAERKSNPAAFKASNAFGKCVSAKAKAAADARKA